MCLLGDFDGNRFVNAFGRRLVLDVDLVALDDLIQTDRLTLGVVQGGRGDDQEAHLCVGRVDHHDLGLRALGGIGHGHGIDRPDEGRGDGVLSRGLSSLGQAEGDQPEDHKGSQENG